MEKKIKFSSADAASQFERSPRAGRRKVKSKSSTLSLHTLAHEEEEAGSPQLQRRNSIHNVSRSLSSLHIFNATLSHLHHPLCRSPLWT